jgi:hypothetical protein
MTTARSRDPSGDDSKYPTEYEPPCASGWYATDVHDGVGVTEEYRSCSVCHCQREDVPDANDN